MEAQSSSGDIGLVNLEWLQSDDSFSFDAFSDIDELMADLPDFAPVQRWCHTPTSINQVWHHTPKTVGVCNN